jgi:Uma2 family endonuclease
VETATPVGRGPFTAGDILGRTPEDNIRREVIDGWLYLDGQPADHPMASVAAESASPRHQAVVVELVLLLSRYRDEHPGQLFVAPMDCLFDGHLLQPDVFYLDSLDRVGHPVQTVPALIVEVSSPSTRRHDLVRKRRAYEAVGVPEYWFADLDALRIARYARGDDGRYGTPDLVAQEQLTSTSLPGLTVDVNELLGQEDDG